MVFFKRVQFKQKSNIPGLERARRTPKKALLWIGSIFGTTLLAFFFLSFFQITQITIKSEVICTNQTAIKQALHLTYANLLLVNTGALEGELIKKYLCIKGVIFTRKWPHTLEVSILARQPALVFDLVPDVASVSSVDLLQAKNLESSPAARLIEATAEAKLTQTLEFPQPEATVSGQLIVDSSGVIFAQNESVSVPHVQINLPNAKLGDKVDSRIIQNSQKIFSRLKSLGFTVLNSKIVDQLYLLVVAESQTEKASTLKLGFTLDGQHLRELASLQLILQKNRIDLRSIEIVDLRFDKPIVQYKSKNSNY